MIARTLVLAGLLLSASASIAAAEEQQPTLFSQNPPKNPYAKLFTRTTVATQRPPVHNQTEPTQPAKPKVVCGMMVMPVDASVDPRMRVSPPTDDNTTHTIRAVKPPMCTSE